MGKLEDMRVERVDGVDRPATGHRWVIVKSETPDEVEKDYAGAARAAIDALAKEEGISVSKETAEALTALAALLEMSVEFKSVEGAPAASESTDDDPEATDDEPLTKATLKDALMEIFASDEEDEDEDEDDDEEEVEKTKPKSRQPEEQDDVEKGAPLTSRRVRKSGRPDFSNVIFNQ